MADLIVDCPSCGCPGGLAGVACGMCGLTIPMPASALAPDGTVRETAEVIGYRGWKITRDNGRPRLQSPIFPLIWEPGQIMVAECRGHGHSDPTTPNYHGPLATDPAQWSPVKSCGGSGHGCGFYAGRSREHLLSMPQYVRYTESDPTVIGKVQMSGKIIPATNGWRAQECSVHTIYVPYECWELARDLKEDYGPHGTIIEVSSTMMMPKDDAPKWCRKCGAAMERSTTCPLCGNKHLT